MLMNGTDFRGAYPMTCVYKGVAVAKLALVLSLAMNSVTYG